MRLSLGFVGYTVFSVLAEANLVHIDVSQSGNIAVDIDTKQQEQNPTKPKSSRINKPTYPPKEQFHILDKYEVDLDYEVHSGIDKGKYIAFENIPYAEPPLGENRFLEPIYVQTRRNEVNNGSVGNICPQMQIGWVPQAMDFLGDFNKTAFPLKWLQPIDSSKYGEVPAQDPRVNEDCLTLTVNVPKAVWEDRNKPAIYKPAVIVWIHGGGFVFGWKDQEGSPEGLFDAAGKPDEQNIIHVSVNYRLGAFGWLGGRKFYEEGGTPNIGLRDQAFALKWVAQNIWQFGGDSRRVTAMGQSAGASSILHLITASKGQENRPAFKQAILQSPGFFPQPNKTLDDETYNQYLSLTGAKDFDELQKVNTSVLMDANANMTWQSTYGYFKFGPTVDYDFVADLPGKLLKTGNFHKGFPLLLGYAKLDGLLFTPPWIRTKVALQNHIVKLFAKVPQSVLNYIGDNYPITALIPQRRLLQVSDFFDDLAIQCNTQYLTEATLASESSLYHPVYRYSFNALPAVHGYDLGYAYYPSKPLISPVDPDLAKYFQQTVVDFARYTDPNPEDKVLWEEYKSDKRRVMNFGDPAQETEVDYSHSTGDDLLNKTKCEYWQTAPFYIPEEKKSQVGDEKLVVQDGEHMKWDFKEGL